MVELLPEVEVCGELTLHLLEDGVLGGGLGSTRQRLGRGAGERRRHARHVLDAHAERAHQLLHEVQRVGGDGRLRH